MSIIDKFKKEKEQTVKKSVAKRASKKIEDAEVGKTVVTEEKKPKKVANNKKKGDSDAKSVAKKAVSSISKISLQTLVRPIVSEKTARLNDESVIVFEVAKSANRVQVRNAFREMYKITPVSVNIINVRGKQVRFGRTSGKRNDLKKALITLPKGKHVDIFEGV
ncbi:50S ribosomal protein L23 [Patescibacteria group bacterium]|nr:50S ribosomal protein L23 [Patescibacteria group bacterium]